jgi:DNA (cytosine-5)-methyltransferase 1
MAAYYNENDKPTAAWLRELIKAGLIADGEVDERSIDDVRPNDLRGFVQCHFFAGIGGWSYALRLARWPDDRHVWTGSCPCQPWSMAGEGQGTNDPRHLWPAWQRLIEECRPTVVFGEQTASLDGLYWLDLVYAGLEASDYAIGTADISGACLGSPDIRPRLWFVADRWMADAKCRAPERHGLTLGDQAGAIEGSAPEWQRLRIDARYGGELGGMEHAERERAGRSARGQGRTKRSASSSGQDEGSGLVQALDSSATSWLGHADRERCDGEPVCLQQRGPQPAVPETAGGSTARGLADSKGSRLAQRGIHGRIQPGTLGTYEGQATECSSMLSGFWADCDWIYCRPEPRYPEGCYRPIEPGAFPLATGVPARILRLRGYGNSIKPHVAAAFIQAYCEARGI